MRKLKGKDKAPEPDLLEDDDDDDDDDLEEGGSGSGSEVSLFSSNSWLTSAQFIVWHTHTHPIVASCFLSGALERQVCFQWTAGVAATS